MDSENTRIRRLQLIQNNAACIISRSKKTVSITPILHSLHWLPIESRIEYKIILLTFKSLNGLAPTYLSELLIPYNPIRTVKSSNSNLLQEHEPRTIKHGERAFVNCAPQLWNSLPNDMRLCESQDIFKKKLKTFLFKNAFEMS